MHVVIGQENREKCLQEEALLAVKSSWWHWWKQSMH